MRSSRLVSLDLLVARKRVRDLGVELIEARLAERDRIVEMAGQGKTLKEIARTMGVTYAAAQGVLHRAEQPISGKRRVRISRGLDIAGMLDAKLLLALRHRAPERVAGGAS